MANNPPEGFPCAVSDEAYRSSLREARRRVPADLHLHLGRRPFPAHQFVLRALSERIDALCRQAGPGVAVALDCGPLGVAPADLDAFLDVAYGGSAPTRRLAGVRQLAEYYQVGVVLDCLPEPDGGGRRRGRKKKGAVLAAAKTIKREPVEELVELEPVEAKTCFKRPRRKSAAGRALKSSALTATRRAAPSPRSSPDWSARVMVRRSPRFCKEGEAVHLRSPPAAARKPPPRVKTEPLQRDEEEDDDDTDIEDSHEDIKDSHDTDIEENHLDIKENHLDIKENHLDIKENHLDIKDSHDDVKDSHGDTKNSHDDTKDSHDDIKENHFDIKDIIDIKDSHDDARGDVEGGSSSSSDDDDDVDDDDDDDGDDCEIVGETAPSRPSFLVPGRRNYAAELSPAQLVPRTPDLRADATNSGPPTPRPVPPEEGRAAPVPPSQGFDFLSLVPPPEDNGGGDPFRSLFYGTERRLLGVQASADAPLPKRPADAEGHESKRPRNCDPPRFESISNPDRESHFAHREESPKKNRCAAPAAPASVTRYPNAGSCTTPSAVTATCYPAARSCTTPSTITASSCNTPSTITAMSRYPTVSSGATPSSMTAASRYPTSGSFATPSASTTASRYPTSSSFATPSASSHPTSSSGTFAATSSGDTPSAISLNRCTVPEPAQQGGPTYVKTYIQRLTERDRRTGEVKVRQVARVSELDSDMREQGRATTTLFRSCERPALVREEKKPRSRHNTLRMKGKKEK